MSQYTARQVHLVARPQALPSHNDFNLVEIDLAPPADGQVLVANRYMSVDPYMRGRMRAEGVYAAPYGLNEVMYGGALSAKCWSQTTTVFSPGILYSAMPDGEIGSWLMPKR